MNVPRVARTAVGRLAFEHGKFVGDFVRGLLADRILAAGEAGEISRELAMDAVEALVTHGRRAKSAAVTAAKVSCMLIVCWVGVYGGMERRRARSSRRPKTEMVRVVRRSARKIGEWEVRPS